MTELVFEAPDEESTRRFGAALAGVLPPGITVALIGTLGAGKTRLVQAIAEACGVARDEVVSPTFVLCQQYRGTRKINHLDAYRLKDVDEFRELGGDELLNSDAMTFIEWADRIADALPDEFLEIEMHVTGPTSRSFHVRAIGNGVANAVANLGQAVRRQT